VITSRGWRRIRGRRRHGRVVITDGVGAYVRSPGTEPSGDPWHTGDGRLG
jgi:hypothetical protein